MKLSALNITRINLNVAMLKLMLHSARDVARQSNLVENKLMLSGRGSCIELDVTRGPLKSLSKYLGFLFIMHFDVILGLLLSL